MKNSNPNFVGAGLRPARQPVHSSLWAGLRPAPTVITVLVLFIFACGEEKGATKIPTPVRVRAVENYAEGNQIRYSADIEPRHEVKLAFKVGGYVEGFYQIRDADGVLRDVQSGDFVKRGTILARLRKSEFQARVQQSRAQLGQAKAAAQNSSLELGRATKLYETESLTKSDFDGATARDEEARARVDAATASLQDAQISLQDSDLRSPIEGIVVERNLETGDLASPGSTAFVLADTTTVKAIFGVPDVLISRFSIGQKLTVLLEAVPGLEFQGLVTRISPAADSRNRLFETEISLANDQNLIKSGMIATIVVKPPQMAGPVLVVPLTSVVAGKSGADRYAVMVVQTQGNKSIANIREVTLGETFGDRIAVNGGVNEGESVITVGATLVQSGEEVKIIP